MVWRSKQSPTWAESILILAPVCTGLGAVDVLDVVGVLDTVGVLEALVCDVDDDEAGAGPGFWTR